MRTPCEEIDVKTGEPCWTRQKHRDASVRNRRTVMPRGQCAYCRDWTLKLHSQCLSCEVNTRQRRHACRRL
ncbi:hypothetical protein BDR03DRAFT_952912, partial [Suillus americanus]